MSEKLTPKQIANWRKMMGMMGIDASILSDEEVEMFRNAFQQHVENEVKAEEAKKCKTK